MRIESTCCLLVEIPNEFIRSIIEETPPHLTMISSHFGDAISEYPSVSNWGDCQLPPYGFGMASFSIICREESDSLRMMRREDARMLT
jgi:hypothetical protein